MMERFACTSCGRCCHDLRLTLNVSEALEWLERGGQIQILCDALPVLDADAGQSRFRLDRSFTAMSGTLSISIHMLLVAHFSGPCPNLMPDLRCGIYAERPNVCRTYPADANPEKEITPDLRLCPGDAWAPTAPHFMTAEGAIADDVTRIAIHAARQSGVNEVSAKQWLAGHLGINCTALANAGFAVWSPDPALLVSALRHVVQGEPLPEPQHAQWSFVSDRQDIRAMIVEAGATVEAQPTSPDLTYLTMG